MPGVTRFGAIGGKPLGVVTTPLGSRGLKHYVQWRNRRGAGGRVSPRLLTGKFLLTNREKEARKKLKKGKIEKKGRKTAKGKVEN